MVYNARMRAFSLGLLCLLVPLWGASARAEPHPLAPRVLVVVNANSQRSVTLGEAYLNARGVPQANLARLHCTTAEEIGRETYERDIRDALAGWLSARAMQDQVLFVVTTLDVPLKIRGEEGPDTDRAAVDSELTLLYRNLLLGPHPLEGRLANPYFAGEDAAQLRPFRRSEHDIYLVNRLAGYGLEESLALIERAAGAGPGGRFVFDARNGRLDVGQGWMKQARDWLRDHGHETLFNTRAREVLHDLDDVMGYCGWGSNDPARTRRFLGFDWRPGALAINYVSTNARTFQWPPSGWAPGPAGGQTLVADDIHDGVTIVNGHVYEPWLDACARPAVVFPAYVQGHTAAEAMYLGMPYLSWMNIVIGDPLCAPYATQDHPAIQEPFEGAPYFHHRKQLIQAHLAEQGGR